MAYIMRDGDIVPVAIPVGKRIKIGSMYNPPRENYVANDQLWIQDIFTFNQIPWYAIKNRYEKYLFLFVMWFGVTLMLGMIGRYWLGAPQ